MSKKLVTIFVATLLLFGTAAGLLALALPAAHVQAACSQTNDELDLCRLPSPQTQDKSLIESAATIVFGILGAISFFVITLAGFQYVISRGDPQGIAKSKNTIIYAIIGLLLAISAEAIVAFVFGRVAL